MKKKINEKDVRALWIFCAVTATITDVLCVLFLLNVVQNHWFLNFIQALAVLLHLSLLLLGLLKKKLVFSIGSAVLMLAYAGRLIYYNL